MIKKPYSLVSSFGVTSDIQSIIPISKGGTGATTASDALDNLGAQHILTAGSNITIENNVISSTVERYNPATETTDGLMSSTDKAKLNGIASGANVNVQSDWNQTDTSADDFIKNKPTIPTQLSDLSGTLPILQGGTGGTSAIEARTNLELMKGYELFSNSYGSQGTITLSDDVKNYSYVEIFYRQDDSNFNSVKIENPSGKSITFENIQYYSDKLYMRAAIAILNENTLTWESDSYGYKVISASGTISGSAINMFYVTKILGYKY